MRETKIINSQWDFTKQGERVTLDLPHTWNGKDGQDGGNDYFRGTCTYEKTLKREDFPLGEEFYLQFDGVNSSATVYFNGEKLTTHHGGYSAFRVKLENIKDENKVKVEVDNSPNDFVYPQQADFTFYGGIYRSVTLIGVSHNHFSLDRFGSNAIAVTPDIKGNIASVNVKTFTQGLGEIHVFVDGKELVGSDVTFEIESPHLWNGTKDPFLYTATAQLVVDGVVEDEVSTKFGIRSFKIDAEKGFILNGEVYPLRGVSRHQDRPEIGNALSYEHHKEDMDLICEMGANTIRLAHYQHAQEFYDLCDERGMVVWAEIPYISKHLENGVENTKTQMTELIY